MCVCVCSYTPQDTPNREVIYHHFHWTEEETHETPYFMFMVFSVCVYIPMIESRDCTSIWPEFLASIQFVKFTDVFEHL